MLLRLLHLRLSRHGVWNGSPRHYPQIFPFLGLDLVATICMDFSRGQFSEGIRRRHVLYGRTFSAQILGNNYTYTIEPQNIHTISTREPYNYEKSEWASKAAKHIGNGILLNEGEAWRLSRTTLKPMLASNAIDEPTLMEPHVTRLVARMVAMSKRDGVFEFHSLADMLMLDVVTEFLFEKSTGCLESPPSPAGEDGIDFLTLVRRFDAPSASFIALGTPARVKFLFSSGRLNDMVAGMKAFFERKLADMMANADDAPARASPRSVFREMKARSIPDEQIQGELQNIFFASWDTTSRLLSNTIHALLRHQQVQDRLREEIRHLQGRPPTKQDLNSMGYLRFVIKEGRCMSPPQKL